MEVQDVQEKKLSLINWISQLQDISLIKKLTDLQNDEIKIPYWHKEIVLERIKTAKPDDYVSWNEAKKNL